MTDENVKAALSRIKARLPQFEGTQLLEDIRLLEARLTLTAPSEPVGTGEGCFNAVDIPHGLYKIFWMDGGSSVAAVGSTYDGTRWYAPTNWTTDSKNNPLVASTDWRNVERVEHIDENRAALTRPKVDKCPDGTDFDVGDVLYALNFWGNLYYEDGCKWAHHVLLKYRDYLYNLAERDQSQGLLQAQGVGAPINVVSATCPCGNTIQVNKKITQPKPDQSAVVDWPYVEELKQMALTEFMKGREHSKDLREIAFDIISETFNVLKEKGNLIQPPSRGSR